MISIKNILDLFFRDGIAYLVWVIEILGFFIKKHEITMTFWNKNEENPYQIQNTFKSSNFFPNACIMVNNIIVWTKFLAHYIIK